MKELNLDVVNVMKFDKNGNPIPTFSLKFIINIIEMVLITTIGITTLLVMAPDELIKMLTSKKK
jgi:hypothetical protein